MIRASGLLRPVLPIWPSSGAVRGNEKIIDRGVPGSPDRKICDVVVATLTAFLPERPTGDAIIICPGGGYAAITIDREGHDVGAWLASEGIAGLVLKYRLGRTRSATGNSLRPLTDVRQAVTVARSHAREWGIDPYRIGIMGFSAGGHMAAHAANEEPDLGFSVLVYPLISMETAWTHRYSRRHLLGRWPTADVLKRNSMEYGVSARTAPTFLVHAYDDDVVKIANSQRYEAALQQHGVAHDSLFFGQGGHGFGLGDAKHGTDIWPARCLKWLRERKLLAVPSFP